MFFSNDLRKLGWKVVLWKRVHFRKEVADTKDVFITKNVEKDGLSAPIGLPLAPNIASLISAIELSRKDNLLTYAKSYNRLVELFFPLLITMFTTFEGLNMLIKFGLFLPIHKVLCNAKPVIC